MNNKIALTTLTATFLIEGAALAGGKGACLIEYYPTRNAMRMEQVCHDNTTKEQCEAKWNAVVARRDKSGYTPTGFVKWFKNEEC